MARQFSIPTMLRMIPKPLLRELFSRWELEPDVDWEEVRYRNIEPLTEALQALDVEKQDWLETQLHNVFDLASDSGLESLMEAALWNDTVPVLLQWPEEASTYEKVAWTLLHHPTLVDRALRIFQVQNLNWWRKRNDLPRKEPDVSREAVERLQQELSTFYEGLQGRGKVCTVDTFRRQNGTHYFLAYPDDFVRTVTVHDQEKKLVTQSIRSTFEVAFALCPNTGSLELFVKGPTWLKVRLEELFTRVVLGHHLEPTCTEPAYELDQLKRRDFPLPTDPEDCLRVGIRRMRLSWPGTRRRVTLEADLRMGSEDIYKHLDDMFGHQPQVLDRLDVTMVSFCFELLEKEGRRKGQMTFDVVCPNTCSVRNQRSERIELAQKYLQRWGIDVGSCDKGVAE